MKTRNTTLTRTSGAANRTEAAGANRRSTTDPGDLLDELRTQWTRSGLQGDFDFDEFVSGVTVIDQLIEREFKRYVTSRFRISPGDARILLALRRAGPKQSLRPTDLFKQLLVTSGAITKQLDHLEERGHVRRVFNSEGKRGWLIVLTDAGRRLTDELRGSRAAMPTMSASFYALSEAQRGETLKLLHLLVREIQARTRLNPID